ncbi:MAG: hypothetical protein GX591_06555 [Planctomycetes bacterium]|nr:hypothetical protein [Planctomycetota bacterium]
MREYRIERTPTPPPLSGDVEGTPWADAQVLQIDTYPWYKGGVKQPTAVRLLYDDDALYTQFHCRDRHISAERTELNSTVCLDSCVELFATVDPKAGPDYFNLEMNCCGVFLMGYGPARRPRSAIDQTWAKRVEIVTSVPGPTKAESDRDESWWAAVRLSWDLLSHLAGKPVRPSAGTEWRGNLYRCGGKTDHQFASWNPIDTARWPKPDFHQPESFGRMIFG